VLGYFAAGLAIGPFGFRFITEPLTLLRVAELGVVMFLFIIGLRCPETAALMTPIVILSITRTPLLIRR
jgi:predicted Kef-type K+ transport protein